MMNMGIDIFDLRYLKAPSVGVTPPVERAEQSSIRSAPYSAASIACSTEPQLTSRVIGQIMMCPNGALWFWLD